MPNQPQHRKEKRNLIPAIIAAVVIAAGILFFLNRDGFKFNQRLSNSVSQLEATLAVTINLHSEGDKPVSDFRVLEVSLQATPVQYEGPCPLEIKFKISISTSGNKGTVKFQMLRSDYTSSPVTTVTIDTAGTKEIEFTGNAQGTFLGWQQVAILKPNKIKSNRVDFLVTCH